MERVDLKAVLAGVRPGGCVQQYFEGFAAELISAGYAALPIRDYVRSAAHLGRWLDSRKLGIDMLCEEVIPDFARHPDEYLIQIRTEKRLPFTEGNRTQVVSFGGFRQPFVAVDPLLDVIRLQLVDRQIRMTFLLMVKALIRAW